jgi:hypothetical protein
MIYFESRIDKCLTRNVIRARMATAAKGKDSLLFVVYLFQQKMINFSQKHKAVSAFAIFLKRNVSDFRGMKISRIKIFVEQNLGVCGYVNSPHYFLHGIEDTFNVSFVEGMLMRWNGAFYKTV